jgi:hypothetical protein
LLLCQPPPEPGELPRADLREPALREPALGKPPLREAPLREAPLRDPSVEAPHGLRCNIGQTRRATVQFKFDKQHGYTVVKGMYLYG